MRNPFTQKPQTSAKTTTPVQPPGVATPKPAPVQNYGISSGGMGNGPQAAANVTHQKPVTPAVQPKPVTNNGISSSNMSNSPQGYMPQTTPPAPAETPGFNDFYGNLAQNDFQAAQRDRDVTRAATMREAKEAAISQGIGAGTNRFDAMMGSANASANVQGLQSRNDAATRAQSLMIQQRDEERGNQEQMLDFMDTTQQQEYWKKVGEGLSPTDAMNSLYNEDGTFAVKGLNAAEQAIETQADTLMANDHTGKYPTREAAIAEAKRLGSAAETLKTNELEEDARIEALTGAVLKDFETNKNGVGWGADEWAAAQEEGLLEDMNIIDIGSLSGKKYHEAVKSANNSGNQTFMPGRNVMINGEVYRIAEPLVPGDGQQMVLMTGERAGTQSTFGAIKKEGN